MTQLETLVKKLDDLDKNTERAFFKFADVQFKNDGEKMTLSGGDLDNAVLGPEAFETLCDTLEVPKVYAKRCPPDLQEYTMNYWLEKRPDFYHSALITDEAVRTFMSTQYTYVPTAKVVGAVFDELPGDYLVGNYHLDGKVLEAQVFSPEYDQHVIDSNVRGGLKIVYSDSWNESPKFDTYLYRVMCTNGLVSPLDGKKFRIAGKSESELIHQAKEYVRESLKQIPSMYEGFLAAEGIQIDNVVQLIRKIVQENRLPSKIATMLIETMGTPEFLSTIRGQIRTMHDLVNLLTYVGTHNKELSPSHREHIMSIAGSIVLHNDTRCNSCHSVLH